MVITSISVIALLIIGSIYQKIGIYSDNNKYPQIGKMYKIDGHNMNIYTKGKGDATVVFTSGSGVSSPYVDMYPLFSEISKSAKIAIYDRPGYGWSEQTKTPRDIDTVVKELHTLLEKSGQKAPYILVGHSMAGLEVLRFTQLYKDEVKGVVMIDGASPNFCINFKDPMVNSQYVLQFVKNTGLLRGLRSTNSIKKMLNANNSLSKKLKELNTALTLKNTFDNNMIEERKSLNANGKIVSNGGNIGKIPLILITAGSNGFANWENTQKSLMSFSKDSKQIYLKDASHFIHYEQPGVINKEIKELIDKVNY